MALFKKSQIVPKVRARINARHDEMSARIADPKALLQLLATTYLTNIEEQRKVKLYLQRKAAEQVPTRDDDWNDAVAFVVASLVIPVAARPSNVANISAKAALMPAARTSTSVAIKNVEHKNALKGSLHVVVSLKQYEDFVAPLAIIARKLGSDKVFVTATGKPMRKSTTIFKLVNHGRPSSAKITANDVRHACVRLVYSGQADVTRDEAANVLLHRAGMASKVYNDQDVADVILRDAKFKAALFNL